MDNEVKLELISLDLDELQFTDSGSSDSSSTSDFIEVITAVEDGDAKNAGDHMDSEYGSSNTEAARRPRKRAKLDHLSADQKAQHRKMMNRVSAQSARDRQRALMMQQEQNIATLTSKNTQLQQENTKLKLANEKLLKERSELKTSVTLSIGLVEENSRLKNLIAELERKLRTNDIQAKVIKGKGDDTGCRTLEPAVLDTNPLLKGQGLQPMSAYLLLSAFLLWISTPQKFSELSKTFLNTSSVKTQSFHSNRHLLLKQLVHQLELNREGLQTRLKPPD